MCGYSVAYGLRHVRNFCCDGEIRKAGERVVKHLLARLQPSDPKCGSLEEKINSTEISLVEDGVEFWVTEEAAS